MSIDQWVLEMLGESWYAYQLLYWTSTDVRWSLEAALNNYFRDQEDNASQASGSSGIIVVQGKGQNKDGIAIMPLG